jgi:hypothetical protein
VATRRPAPKSAPRRKAPPPRRGRTLVAVIIGAILGAGGLAVVTLTGPADSGSPTAPTVTGPPTSTTAPAPPSPQNAAGVSTTTALATTTTPETTTTTIPPLQEVIVVVGLDDGPERVDQVPLGATVELRITNPEADDEFHLHGYDLGNTIKVPAGETLTLTFVADRAGLFELESHDTHDTLLWLLVE